MIISMRHVTTFWRAQSLCRALATFPRLMVFASCLAMTVTHAMTDGEKKMYDDPMPHALLGAGSATGTVHLAHMNGFAGGAQNNAFLLSELKKQVEECVARNHAHGVSSSPPGKWPDFLIELRSDQYSSASRSINHQISMGYIVNQNDCSLIEIRTARASLRSWPSTCEIDFIAKTARGVCDASGHAGAKAPPVGTALTRSEIKALERRMAGVATSAPVHFHAPAATGEKMIILGVVCDVWESPGNDGGTVCISRGGSFVSAHATPGMTQSSMELDMSSNRGVNMRAVEVKLNTPVNAGVFTPYLSNGFDITQIGARK